ncbi:hypothetical protein GCM10010975_06450 [Comamonas phosphati]|nr:hypothetical protein GCM10010975_06450 [Comamonas phosphati]
MGMPPTSAMRVGRRTRELAPVFVAVESVVIRILTVEDISVQAIAICGKQPAKCAGMPESGQRADLRTPG